MLRRFVSVAFQALLMLALFGIGSLLPALPGQPLPMWRVSAGETHYFVLDGLLLMLAMYIVILVIEVVRKNIKTSGMFTTLAFVIALLLGLLMKFGLMDKRI